MLVLTKKKKKRKALRVIERQWEGEKRKNSPEIHQDK